MTAVFDWGLEQYDGVHTSATEASYISRLIRRVPAKDADSGDADTRF